ncbi:MAG TPA: CBS domain-containing protein [Methanocella sp.]|nr:CBS domain-containing protein [Methanocella sp.]
MRIKDVMSNEIACVDTKSTAVDAARKMRDQNTGTVIVVDGNDVKGLVTDRQIAVKTVADMKDPKSVPVKDIMTKNIIGCRENDDIFDALKTMGQNKIRRLPVVDDNAQLVGVVSLSDIAREMRTGMDSMFDEITKTVR